MSVYKLPENPTIEDLRCYFVHVRGWSDFQFDSVQAFMSQKRVVENQNDREEG
ncbi:MAG: hypothetical protein JWN04_5082 [Myxococcaceae bacterium]|nr:hypothetical protein [Myxococcaceae bacterium]